MIPLAIVRTLALRLPGAILLALVSLALAPWPAWADSTQHGVCRHEGVLAENLARARDRGMNMGEAIDTVLASDPDATRELVSAQAALLFQRFRRMPAEQAAFEFQHACMDDAQ